MEVHGLHCKKGEHGLETRLWKKTKPKKDSDDESHFFMCKAYLFKLSQVERIKE